MINTKAQSKTLEVTDKFIAISFSKQSIQVRDNKLIIKSTVQFVSTQ